MHATERHTKFAGGPILFLPPPTASFCFSFLQFASPFCSLHFPALLGQAAVPPPLPGLTQLCHLFAHSTPLPFTSYYLLAPSLTGQPTCCLSHHPVHLIPHQATHRLLTGQPIHLQLWLLCFPGSQGRWLQLFPFFFPSSSYSPYFTFSSACPSFSHPLYVCHCLLCMLTWPATISSRHCCICWLLSSIATIQLIPWQWLGLSCNWACANIAFLISGFNFLCVKIAFFFYTWP